MVIQCAGTFGNIIPPGPQILMSSTITYFVKPKDKLCKNVTISTGQTNITEFSLYYQNNGFRDSHVNDAFDGKLAWSWSDNSMITDKTNNITNTMIAMGKIKKGEIKSYPPVQLTDLTPIDFYGTIYGAIIFDTAIAINRADPSNIVVSYTLNSLAGDFPCRAVSFDGGKTWPSPNLQILAYGSVSGNLLTVEINVNGTLAVGQYLYSIIGPPYTGQFDPKTKIIAIGSQAGTYILNISQTVPSTFFLASDPLNGQIPILPAYSGGIGDYRGISSDKFGNFWLSLTSYYDPNENGVNQPIFAVSKDKGVNFEVIYTVPLPDPTLYPPATYYTDYPQFCFGGDENGQYGLWFQTTFYNFNTGDGWPTVGFIPIFSLGEWGSLTSTPPISYTWLQGLTNSIGEMYLSASSKGNVYFQGTIAPSIENSGTICPFSYIQPLCTLFKSPGAITDNYSGSWNYGMWDSVQDNTPSLEVTKTAVISEPQLGYFPCPQSTIYDEKRQALYCIASIRVPGTPSEVQDGEISQNMRLFFIISRNNGQSWSQPIDIAITTFANRGFQSMALDRKLET